MAPRTHGFPLQQHTQIPIEGVGVVHVITEVPADDPGYAFSDVTLQQNVGGRLAEPIPITGSVCERHAALSMHEHWCDLERLIRCLHGDSEALCVLDIDYEIDGDEGSDRPSPSADESQCSDPGLTARVLAIMARADSRYVRTPDLSSTVGLPLEDLAQQ